MQALWLACLASAVTASAGAEKRLSLLLNGDNADSGTPDTELVLTPELLSAPWEKLLDAARHKLARTRQDPDLERPCDLIGANGALEPLEESQV